MEITITNAPTLVIGLIIGILVIVLLFKLSHIPKKEAKKILAEKEKEISNLEEKK